MTTLPPNIEIFYTEDGSPTLNFSRDDGYAEKMHHSGGALSESIYIYHQALLTAVDRNPPPRVLSLGLGLAYNELLAVAELYKAGIEDYKIWSFESAPVLRKSFINWIHGDATTGLPAVIEQVARMVSGYFSLPTAILREQLKKSLFSGRLEIRGSFPEDTTGVTANLVFYDAYSRQMDESLWNENQLVTAMENILLPSCVFSSYAATGALKRSLRRLGFRPTQKTGFKGKRECTMAFRSELL